MRRLLLYGGIIFQILLIISLVRGIQLSKRSETRIEALQIAKAKLLAEQDKLKEQKELVQSPYYLEKVARDELNLSKEGETVVIISENQNAKIPDNQNLEKTSSRANWQKWLSVLSGKI